jgi:membrane protease YdiL (CAAX protease family)
MSRASIRSVYPSHGLLVTLPCVPAHRDDMNRSVFLLFALSVTIVAPCVADDSAPIPAAATDSTIVPTDDIRAELVGGGAGTGADNTLIEPTAAESARDAATEPQIDTETRSVLFGVSSYGSVAIAALAGNLLPDPYRAWTGFTVLGLSTIPLWFVDTGQGAMLSSVVALSFLAAYLIPPEPDLVGGHNFPLSATAFNIGQKLAMWSSYQAYRLTRDEVGRVDVQGSSGATSTGDTLPELLLAPFRVRNMADKSFWIPLLGACATNVIVGILVKGTDESVFSTGRAFVGSTEVPIGLGLLSTLLVSAVNYTFTGIGEEAVFRGLEYQWLTEHFGPVPARMINAITFPAVHVPQEIRNGAGLGSIMFGLSWRAVTTLGLQWAYDTGGLQRSVAQHMWIDTLFGLIEFLLSSGVEREDEALPEVSIGFDLRY